MDHSNLFVHIHADDNIVVSARDLPADTQLRLPAPLAAVTVKQKVGLGHKIAVRSIGIGEPIRKYGHPIGIAKAEIEAGEWVHVHNVELLSDHERTFRFASHASRDDSPVDKVKNSQHSGRHFDGFVRSDGKVGTRNYVAIISSVNCSASVTKAIARHFGPEQLRDFPNVDGVIGLTHHGGCAMQFAGQQHQILNRVLGGMARHPNIGGYLLIGLGCEKATIDHLVDDQNLVQIEGFSTSVRSANGQPGEQQNGGVHDLPGQASRPPTLTMQSVGGTQKTIAAGIEMVNQLLPLANQATRQSVPASELRIATQCGGSDGNSGVTANPALGVACDLVIAEGGTAILGETTEIVGAEHLMTQRAVSESVGRKLLEKIEWWRWYAGIFGETIDDNRSAGNAAGGLTTIAEKSLGAIAKAGTQPLVEVYEYAEQVVKNGLVIMDSPGFDPASITGMVAGGANLVVFTTGRGSCYGCKPSPSIKVATNSPMFQRMKADMDIDAGRILDGTSIEELGQEIFEMMLTVASGQPTKSEAQGLGDEEFVPWMIGPVL